MEPAIQLQKTSPVPTDDFVLAMTFLWILFCVASALAAGPRWHVSFGCLAGLSIGGFLAYRFGVPNLTTLAAGAVLLPVAVSVVSWISSTVSISRMAATATASEMITELERMLDDFEDAPSKQALREIQRKMDAIRSHLKSTELHMDITTLEGRVTLCENRLS